MFTKSIFSALSIIIVLSLSSNAVHAQKVEWQKYTDATSKVSISFPSTYEVGTESKNNDAGEIYTTTKVNTNYESVVYFLGITIHASDFVYSEDLEDASIDAFKEGVSGTETKREVWKRKGHDGVQVTMETADAIMTYRVLIVDRKQIQVIVARPKEMEATPKIYAKFLKSFKM